MLRTAIVLATAAMAAQATPDLPFTVSSLISKGTEMIILDFDPVTGTANGKPVTGIPPPVSGVTATTGGLSLSAVNEEKTLVHYGVQVDAFYPNDTTSVGAPMIFAVDYSTNQFAGAATLGAPFLVSQVLDVGTLAAFADPSGDLVITGTTNAIVKTTSAGGRVVTSYDISLAALNMETNTTTMIAHLFRNLTQVRDAKGCVKEWTGAVAYDPTQRTLVGVMNEICSNATSDTFYVPKREVYIFDVNGWKPTRVIQDPVGVLSTTYDPTTGKFLCVTACSPSSSSCDLRAAVVDPVALVHLDAATETFTSVFESENLIDPNVLAINAATKTVSTVQQNPSKITNLVTIDLTTGEVASPGGFAPTMLLGAWTVPKHQ